MSDIVGSGVYEVIKRAQRHLNLTGKTRSKPGPNSSSHAFQVTESRNVTITIYKWDDRDEAIKLLLGERALVFIKKEFEEWCSPKLQNPGKAYQFAHNRELWEQSLNKRFYYTYQERIRTGYDHLLRELAETPDTRQAFLSIWESLDIRHTGKERVPCTIGYHFQKEKDKLHCTMVMRSTDVRNCLANDLWLGTSLLERVGIDLKMKVGEFTIFTSNLHQYL